MGDWLGTNTSGRLIECAARSELLPAHLPFLPEVAIIGQNQLGYLVRGNCPLRLHADTSTGNLGCEDEAWESARIATRSLSAIPFFKLTSAIEKKPLAESTRKGGV